MRRRRFLGGVAVAGATGLSGCSGILEDCSTDDTFRIYDSAWDGPEYLEFKTESGTVEISLLEVYESETAEIDINNENAVGIEENNSYEIEGLGEIYVDNIVFDDEFGEDTGFVQLSMNEEVRYC